MLIPARFHVERQVQKEGCRRDWPAGFETCSGLGDAGDGAGSLPMAWQGGLELHARSGEKEEKNLLGVEDNGSLEEGTDKWQNDRVANIMNYDGDKVGLIKLKQEM